MFMNMLQLMHACDNNVPVLSRANCRRNEKCNHQSVYDEYSIFDNYAKELEVLNEETG